MQQDIKSTETSPLLAESRQQIAKAPGSDGASTADGSNLGDEREGWSAVTESHEGQEQQDMKKDQVEATSDARKQLKFTFPAMAVGAFLAAMDQTLVVSAYGKIGSDLKSLSKISWIATAYLLTVTSFQPLYGKLSDIFGRKPALLFANIVFGLGCLFCGLAQTMNQLIAARALAGIGGGGLTTVVSILLSDVVPLRQRGTWQGYCNMVYSLGAGIGAPLGGVLADRVSWRWAFLFQPPLNLVAFICVYFVMRLPKTETTNWKSKLRRVDFLGAFILVSAVFTLLLGLDRGSNLSWTKPITVICLSVSAPLMALFIFVEMKVASEPFAPVRVLFERSLLSCYLCNLFSFAAYMATLFYIPLFYQAVGGLSAFEVGLRLLPAIVAGVSGSLFAGIFMRKTGKYYWLTIIAYAGQMVGMIPIILSTGVLAKSTLGISIGIATVGFGSGVGVTSSLIALIANASAADQAVATACSYLFRSLGSVLGVSLSSTIVQQSLRTHLHRSLKSGKDADEIISRVRESLDIIRTLEPGIREIIRECYERATRVVFGWSLCITAGALLSAVFIREKKLSQ